MSKTKHLTNEELAQETLNLQNYRDEMKHLYARSVGYENIKSLYISGAGGYIVELNGEVVLQTIQAFSAIETYYEL